MASDPMPQRPPRLTADTERRMAARELIEGSTDFGRELLKAYPEAIEGALVLVWTDEWIEVRVETLRQDAAGAEPRAHEAGTYAIECLSRRLRGEETVAVWQRPLGEGAQP